MRKAFAGLALLAGVLAAIAGPAAAQEEPSVLRGGSATPTFFGNTGLITLPTARTVGDRGIAGFGYFSDDFNSYGLIGGVGRFEIGGAFLDADDDFGSGDSEFLLNAKLNILNETLVTPGLAIGVTDALDALDLSSSLYVVASKNVTKWIPFLPDLNLHVGYGTGIYGDEVFFGGELAIGTPLSLIPLTRPSISLIAEQVNDQTNVGLRGRYRGFAATVTLFDFEDFGFGVSYTTGLRVW